MRVTILALVSFAAAAAGSAAAQQPTPVPEARPTPAEEHVVAPSLPDQPNKEGVVRPSGSMPTDSEGYVRTNRGAIDPTTKSPAPGSAQGAVPGPGLAGTTPVPTASLAPQRKPTVKAAYLSVRGTVKEYKKGVSITVVEANRRERTVKIAGNASVYEGLAVGDKVVVRIPLGKPADGKTLDQIERQRPLRAPPKSKFSKAQSPAS